VKLTVLTYNIHKCIGGLDRRYDPGRVRDAILPHGPDLVLLQEVDQLTRRANSDKQVDILGDWLGLRHRTYFPNVHLRTGGGYGNAILSRFPFTETSNFDVSVPLKKKRSVLHARFRVRLGADARARTLHVFNLHLGLSGIERKLQLRRFLASPALERLHARTPVLVAGDFNDLWGTLGKKLLGPAGFRGMPRPIPTFPAYSPLRALDSIYVRGDLRVGHVLRPRSVVARTASDHLPLVAEVEME